MKCIVCGYEVSLDQPAIKAVDELETHLAEEHGIDF